jgi:hypothetical protein
MRTAVLARIERANLVLGVVATSVAGLLWGGRGMLAAAAGAALAGANFWALRRLGARAVARVQAGALGPALGLAAALIGKMTILFTLVWLAVRVAGLPALPFALGLSVFVVAILIVGWSAVAAGEEAEV